MDARLASAIPAKELLGGQSAVEMSEIDLEIGSLSYNEEILSKRSQEIVRSFRKKLEDREVLRLKTSSQKSKMDFLGFTQYSDAIKNDSYFDDRLKSDRALRARLRGGLEQLDSPTLKSDVRRFMAISDASELHPSPLTFIWYLRQSFNQLWT